MTTITRNGTEYRVTIERDDFSYAPWEECDGHGVVSDWEHRDKAPGELVLVSDRGSKRFYDFAESVKLARRDRWGSVGDEGMTAGAKAAKAARADYEYLRDWCEDRWFYAVVELTEIRTDHDGIEYDGFSAFIGGVEYWDYDDSKNGYINEDVLPNLIADIEAQHKQAALV